MTPKTSLTRLATLALVAASLSACASTRAPDPRDPLEGWNRGVYAANQELDRFVVEPVTVVYRTVVPSVARDGVHNALGNLSEPIYTLNHLFRGDLGGAGTSVHRLLVNSTLGLGGLIDVATHNDIERRPAAFDGTLAHWGVGEGSFLIVPVLGPSTTRGLGGRVVDYFLDPLYHASSHTLLGKIDDGETAARVLDVRSQRMDRGPVDLGDDPYRRIRGWTLAPQRSAERNAEEE